MAYQPRAKGGQAVSGVVLGLIGLALVTVTPVAAQPPNGGPPGGVGNPSVPGPPGGGIWGPGLNPRQTPELSSLALFGTGAAGMGAYALARLRAGRRRR